MGECVLEGVRGGMGCVVDGVRGGCVFEGVHGGRVLDGVGKGYLLGVCGGRVFDGVGRGCVFEVVRGSFAGEGESRGCDGLLNDIIASKWSSMNV